jgi:chromosome segregation ATPase
MPAADGLELSGLAVLGTLGSVCAVLLRSTHKNLDSLEQMRREATGVIDRLRAELRDHDEAISNLQALCADYRYHIGALRAERKQLRLEIERLQRAAAPTPNLIDPTKGQ